jgi:hypothetical protein
MSSNRIALAIVCAAFACAPSLAADVPIEVKSEFRQNVVKRDRLVRQLASIDSKAADAVVAGKAPVALHAQQTELQDKIDLLQLRIETMAVRWNLDIPQPPKPGSADMDESVLSEKRIDTAFTTGHERTDRALQERCRQMLASIDYETFLVRPL